jgi:hypothetical protein
MPMAARVLSEASIPRAQIQAASLGRSIKVNQVERFNARTVLRQHRGELPGIGETKDMVEACATLVEALWIRPDLVRPGDKGKRARDYIVNPRLLQNLSRVA